MKPEEVERETGVPKRTVYHWAKANGWKSALGRDATTMIAENRLRLLIEKEDKTELELKELEMLPAAFERLIVIEEKKWVKALKTSERESSKVEGASPPEEKKKSGRSKKTNDFSQIIEEDLMRLFMEKLFGYQTDLWDHKRQRIRNILKSRQIGLTWYFAREAFCDALLTGRNKVFLSASRAQAGIFRSYIRGFAKAWFNIDLKGKDEIAILTHNTDPEEGTNLYFLSTNAATSQGYHGDLYLDEYFWIPNWSNLQNLASGMASHKKWCLTYFSTPSVTTHGAYPF